MAIRRLAKAISCDFVEKSDTNDENVVMVTPTTEKIDGDAMNAVNGSLRRTRAVKAVVSSLVRRPSSSEGVWVTALLHALGYDSISLSQPTRVAFYFNTRRPPYKYGMAAYDYESNFFNHHRLMVS